MNNVPHGYKQTEVGVIPEDWGVVRLGDIAVVRDGTHQTPKYVVSGVPFYSVEQVTSGDFTNTKFISEQEHKFLTRSFKIEKDDVLMTRIGSIGDCKLIDWDVEASFYVSLALLKIRGASAAFISQYSNATAFKSEVELHSLPSAIPKKINLGPISEIRIALPPTFAEQEAIAEALSDADALIESLEQLIAKKRQIKQGAMQELLTGKKRLPGFAPTGTHHPVGARRAVPLHAERHDIPDGWEVKPLGEISPLQRGFDLPHSKRMEGSYPVVYSNGILNHHNVFQVKGPGVVTGRSGTIGAVTFVEQDFWPHNTSLWVTSFKGNDPKFIFYLYTTIGLERFSTGSGVPTLNRNDVHAYMVKIPVVKAEQTAIATILSDMDAELAALEIKLTKARQLKQGMMQELLTGRIRLL